MNSSNNYLFYKTRQNILDMLEYRGFSTKPYQNFCKEELDILYEKNTQNILVDHSSKDESCLVHYIKEKISKNNLRTLLGDLKYNNSFNNKLGLFTDKNIEEGLIKENTKTIVIVIVTNELITEPLMLELQKIVNSYYSFHKNEIYIQLFCIKRFIINLLDHSLVPKHEIMNETDYVNEVEKVYNITNKSNQLPSIKRDDPVAKYIGLRPGHVCKIIRPSESCGVYINYRYCK